jgi:RHS repeat-associated protein
VVLNEDFIINQTNAPENALYFYHTDHLGSSSWITDASGAVNQHIQYLPFGESFISQKVSSYDVRYKFTGKERDAETGYVPKAFGIGARYYSSELSVWLSVDPLADKYPSTSPYMYVRGNPVTLIDPNGMNDHEYEYNAETGEYKYLSDLGGEEVDFIHHKGGEHDEQTEIINQCENKSIFMSSSKFIEGYSHRGKDVNWKTIYNEWKNGIGPEKSLISGNEHQMNKDLLDSYQVNKAYEEYVANGEDSKYYFKGDFGIIGAIRAGANMTEQMVGSAAVSIYPVGNLLVITIMDSKSISSWTLNPFDGDEVNISRTKTSSPPKSTTYQTYVIIIERSKMKRINELYNEANSPD